MQHSTEIDGLTIHYWEYHATKQPVIVMIHGFTGSNEGFQYIVPLLNDYRIIIPDLPGFGRSDLPPESEWDINHLAARLNAFVASLQLKTPPILLGHSMGGLVVPSMLSQSPDLYHQKVILVSPVPTPVRSIDSRKLGALLGALQYQIGMTIPGIGPRIVRSRTLARVATITMLTTKNKRLRKGIHQHHFGNLDYISSIPYYRRLHTDINRRGAVDYASELRKRDVLLLVGAQDNVTPGKEIDTLIRVAQLSTYEIVPATGHLIHYEKPESIARAVRAFTDKS